MEGVQEEKRGGGCSHVDEVVEWDVEEEEERGLAGGKGGGE